MYTRLKVKREIERAFSWFTTGWHKGLLYWWTYDQDPITMDFSLNVVYVKVYPFYIYQVVSYCNVKTKNKHSCNLTDICIEGLLFV